MKKHTKDDAGIGYKMIRIRWKCEARIDGNTPEEEYKTSLKSVDKRLINIYKRITEKPVVFIHKQPKAYKKAYLGYDIW